MNTMTDEPQPKREPLVESESACPGRAPEVPFEAIAHGSNEVLIEYRGQLYRLRATRNGKLILNK